MSWVHLPRCLRRGDSIWVLATDSDRLAEKALELPEVWRKGRLGTDSDMIRVCFNMFFFVLCFCLNVGTTH